MNIFAVFVFLVPLIVMWLPTLLAARRLQPSEPQRRVHELFVIWPIQVAVTGALCFIADYVGLLNPLGYILGISLLVGLAGATVLVFWRRSANNAFKRTGFARRLT